MAYPVTINGRTYTLADFEGTNYVDGFPDALEDFVTQAGDIYNSTSTTSNTVGTGSKTFTTADSGKPYQAGTPLRIADAAAPATNWMDCIVTSYSGTTLVVNAFGYAGSGTKTSWNINIGGAKTVDGTLAIAQGGTGATTASAAADNLGLGTGDSPTFAGATLTGDLTIPDKIIHAGDTNTAIRFPSADTVTVETAGSERVRVDSSGNVGIGTNSASAWNSPTLQIAGTVSLTNIQTSTQLTNNAFFDGAWKYQTTAASANYFQLAGEHVWRVAASGTAGSALTWTEALRINATGNVGIGTTSPAYPLDVDGKIRTTDDVYLTSGSASQVRFADSTDTNGYTLRANVSNVSDFGLLFEKLDGTDLYNLGRDDPHIWFSATGVERMRIDSSGNVGIGTTSPGTELDVNGDITADGIYLGGTGAANYLDDYEEGTFTPTATASSGAFTTTSNTGTYRKVGSMVYVHMSIGIANVGTGSGYINLAGLPFAFTTTGGSGQVPLIVRETGITGDLFGGFLGNTSTDGRIHGFASATTTVNPQTGDRFNIAACYITS